MSRSKRTKNCPQCDGQKKICINCGHAVRTTMGYDKVCMCNLQQFVDCPHCVGRGEVEKS